VIAATPGAALPALVELITGNAAERGSAEARGET
jgi:hypothetical protein